MAAKFAPNQLLRSVADTAFANDSPPPSSNRVPHGMDSCASCQVISWAGYLFLSIPDGIMKISTAPSILMVGSLMACRKFIFCSSGLQIHPTATSKNMKAALRSADVIGPMDLSSFLSVDWTFSLSWYLGLMQSLKNTRVSTTQDNGIRVMVMGIASSIQWLNDRSI